MDEQKSAEQDAQCACGSGKKNGACCGASEMCACESGKSAGECCYASAPAGGEGEGVIGVDSEGMTMPDEENKDVMDAPASSDEGISTPDEGSAEMPVDEEKKDDDSIM